MEERKRGGWVVVVFQHEIFSPGRRVRGWMTLAKRQLVVYLDNMYIVPTSGGMYDI